MAIRKQAILVVESEPVVCSVVQEILEQDGYLVRTASDLGVAVDKLKELPVDLMVIGKYISETPGAEAVVFLWKKCPKMRVLMMAGFPDDPRVQNRTVLRGVEVFPPPFHGADLRKKVKEVLASNRGNG